MSVIPNIFTALVGLAAISIGIFGREFYWSKSLEAVVSSGERAPTWAGRLLFLIVGMLLLIFSIKQMIWGGPDS